jgi:predicted metal-dependent hydrolase
VSIWYRESHYLWGKRYLFQVREGLAGAKVEVKHRHIVMYAPQGTSEAARQAILEAGYRQQLKATIPDLIEKWEPLMGVKVERFYVRRMKTKWGSCNATARSIRLNTELAKKPREYLEYIVVHEMVHLLEPTHNKRFLS